MSRLRGYQKEMADRVQTSWSEGFNGVMSRMGTGTGKTVIMGHLARQHDGVGMAMAHRQELVGQISAAMGAEEIRHNIIAPQKVIKEICAGHMERFGRTYYDPNASWHVAGVDTLARRNFDQKFLNSITLAIPDEAHHVLRENKWGVQLSRFSNAKFWLPTATPGRCDGRGLGSHADGMADILLHGPEMRQSINDGYLTDYKYMCASTSDLDLSHVDIGPSGELNQEQMRKAIHKSRKLVGNVVEHYCTHAWGKRGVTFAADLEHAKEITEAFCKAGVPALMVHADSSDEERRSAIRKLRNKEVWQLVNVDLFGEGFDLPAIECVSMARPTQSLPLYIQQCGRALRLMISNILMAAWDTFTVAQRLMFIAQSEKPIAYIFDHVGNYYAHGGPPDKHRDWNLDPRPKGVRGAPSDAIPLRTCVNEMCMQPYERIYPACPACGMLAPPPASRSSPQQVDGNLFELTHEALALARGAVHKVDGHCYAPRGVSAITAASISNKHHARQVEQGRLRAAMDLWAGQRGAESLAVSYQMFFHRYGIDVLGAAALGVPEAAALRAKIEFDLGINVADER